MIPMTLHRLNVGEQRNNRIHGDSRSIFLLQILCLVLLIDDHMHSLPFAPASVRHGCFPDRQLIASSRKYALSRFFKFILFADAQSKLLITSFANSTVVGKMASCDSFACVSSNDMKTNLFILS